MNRFKTLSVSRRVIKNVIVMGDFNASVGEGSDEKVVGKYGLGKSYDRGQMLTEFCFKNQLVITNIVSTINAKVIHLEEVQ